MNEVRGARTPEHDHVEWEVERLSIGDSIMPSSLLYEEIYRHQGERIQRQERLEVPFSDTAQRNLRMKAVDVVRMAEFLTSHKDLRVDLLTHRPNGGPFPYLMIVGWREMATPQDIDIYENHKREDERFRQHQ